MFPPHHLVPLPGLLYYGTCFFSSQKFFFFVLCKELELACFIMFSSRYCSRSFFSSLINSLAPSHRSAVCLLGCSCALFLLLSRCLIYPARFWKGGNAAVRTHIPYSPTPVRSASIYSCAGFILLSLFPWSF